MLSILQAPLSQQNYALSACKNKIDTRRLTATIFYVSFCYLFANWLYLRNAKKEKTECQLIDISFPAEEHKKPEPKQPERVTQKAAEMFNTNRTYVSEAIKLKDTAPEVFEQVKNGA
jgi:hypothetical protein